jgi:hypothetical protein
MKKNIVQKYSSLIIPIIWCKVWDFFFEFFKLQYLKKKLEFAIVASDYVILCFAILAFCCVIFLCLKF